MNRIDFYITKLFWGYFIGGILVFVTIFLAIDAMSTMVTYKGVETAIMLKYYAFYTPEIIQKMLPVACLLGTILTVSSLNKGGELVALFSCGMSLIRVVTSILISILLISAFSYYLSDRIMPQMAKNKNFIFYNHIRKNPSLFSTIKTNRIWYRSKNTIFNIKTLNVDGTKAQGLTLYFFNEAWDLLQMLTADEVELKGEKWDLKRGSVTIFSKQESFPLTSNFNAKTIVMGEEAKDIQGSGQTSELLTQSELKRFIEKNREAGLDTIRYEVDYHAKFGFAVAGLIMSLLGLPFSVSKARSGGTMLNVGIAIGLVFAYWVILSSFLTLGGHGYVPPILAAWAPNILLGSLAGLLIYRLKR